MQLEIILATSSNQEVMEEDMEIEEIRQTSNKRKENKKFLLEDSLMRLQMMKSLNSLRRVMFNLMNLEHSKVFFYFYFSYLIFCSISFHIFFF